MKTLIIYDSAYGNTERIARTLAEEATRYGIAKVWNVSEHPVPLLHEYDLVVAGSPTHGGRPKTELKEYLESLDSDALDSVQAAAFDTRFGMTDHNLPLKLLMKAIGYAAPRIDKALRAAGAEIIAEPAGFIVRDKEGPLLDGELDRAKEWMLMLITRASELPEVTLPRVSYHAG